MTCSGGYPEGPNKFMWAINLRDFPRSRMILGKQKKIDFELISVS